MTVAERVLISDPECAKDPHDENIVRYRFASKYSKNLKVLDVACGSGYGTTMLATGGCAQYVVGIDAGLELGTYLVEHTLKGKTEFVLADALRTPVQDGSFDLVVSFETIEHVSDPSCFLGELRRVLRPGGIAIISTPLNNEPSRFTPDNPFHVREFSVDEFSVLLRSKFPQVEFWSQVTECADDIATFESGALNSDSALRLILRTIVPRSVRRIGRQALGSNGRRPVHSTIVHGIDARANVQIGICKTSDDEAHLPAF